MRRRTIFAAAPVVTVFMFAAAHAGAAGEAPFLMQDHGQVRVLRGLDSGRDFEAAKLPQEIELAPAAGAPATSSTPATPSSAAPPRPGAPQPQAKSTRQRALDRVAEQGIRVTPAGGRSVSPRSGETRRQALERLRQRGSPAD